MRSRRPPHRRIKLALLMFLGALSSCCWHRRNRCCATSSSAAKPPSSLSSPFRRRPREQPTITTNRVVTRVSAIDCVKTAIAGGIAGAVGTATLYPLDAAKTIRQASPHTYRSVRSALQHLVESKTVYRGAWTAILGAIPSSALYFGAYETAKRCLLAARANFATDHPASSLARPSSFGQRLLLHASAAASGNLVSSAVFVPKELVKQRLQYCSTPSSTWLTVIADIIHDKGVMGLYTGYLATVLRNVPSAALRFGLYEELKRCWTMSDNGNNNNNNNNNGSAQPPLLYWRLFAAGAIAGALASGIMTPVDVLKTRVSTGTCPVDLPGCMQHIVQVDGWPALFAGAGSRMATSAAFSSIGFGTFEAAKRLLRIPPLETRTTVIDQKQPNVGAETTPRINKPLAFHHHCPRPLLAVDPTDRCCRLANLRLHTVPPSPADPTTIIMTPALISTVTNYC